MHRIRDAAWAIRPYPCTGLGLFLLPYVSCSSKYAQIQQTIKDGGIFLDIGCHIGSDIRRMVFDGMPSDKMVAIDIISQWKVGYDMYRDQARLKAKFVEADLLIAYSIPALLELLGNVDVINISAVLHQWDEEGRKEAVKQVIKFSKVGTLIVGYHIGNVKAHLIPVYGTELWRDSAESYAEMWDEVGKETGTAWKTEASLMEWDKLGWDVEDLRFIREGDRVLEFAVTRVR